MSLKKINHIEIDDDCNNVRLFCVIRNEQDRIPYFMSYYQNMGIKNYFFINNNSTDGTEKSLLKYSGVQVFSTSDSFERTTRVHLKNILNEYGSNRWCLCVDADEFFRFPFDKFVSLIDLTRFLESRKVYAVKVLLLDMYANSKLSDISPQVILDPFLYLKYYDKKVDYLQNKKGVAVGGVRKRIFGLNQICLTKYPLFKLIEPIHPSYWGFHENPGVNRIDVSGILFHFKFLKCFERRASQEAIRGQHWNNAEEYKDYIKVDLPSLNLYSEGDSAQFAGMYQLFLRKYVSVGLSYLLYVANLKVKHLLHH